ncbi:MAG: bifunctional diaminohydroxyphosphoribosylaminopyrimidine deaminase/5-amino-6-(5-phosphoribosylamino)uracil reductase RibD [Wenzhouxiangella sp.]
MTDAFSAAEHAHMAEALRLAEQGLWTTDPNPRVGCVLAHAAEIVGRGWHQRAGEPHAEVFALREAGPRARGATAFVTLEPCSHYGRTPPCADALIDAGVAEVVVAMTDPHPRVAGSGLERLRAAGIRVRSGLLAAAARELNLGFISRHERGRPWVRLKLACSLDGRTAGPDGRSQWITAEAARLDGQRWRARASAILSGIGTVLADDPGLNVRLPGIERQPLRVVLDSQARLPRSARLLALPGETKVASLEPAPWAANRVEWRQLPAGSDQRVALGAVMRWLAELQVNELHVEAGPTLAGALMEGGWVDELLLYQSAVLLGDGAPLLHLPGLEIFEQRHHLDLVDQRRVGPDQRFIFRPRPSP